jgi:hypothetical protein
MNKKREEVLAVLQSGPVRYREVIHGRSAAFQLAYTQLLREGLVEVHGSGNAHDPKYVGLKGATFPDKGYVVRSADINLLVRSGMTPEDAEAALRHAVQGGHMAVLSLCEQAYNRILSFGKSPLVHRPPKPRKGWKPISFDSVNGEGLLSEEDF